MKHGCPNVRVISIPHFMTLYQRQAAMNLLGMLMDIVMMKTTLKLASLMVGTAVGLILMQHTAQFVNV